MSVSDVEMMANPDLWPLDPVLPIKRTTQPRKPWFKFGFLVRGQGPKVFIGTIYDDPTTLAVKSYASFEDVRIDGWMVD
jgi:hypothetical protein